MTALQGIIHTLKDTYDGMAWHGSSVKEVLSKIPSNKTGARIGNSHAIIELVLHMTAWRTFVIQKLQGNNEYKVSDEANFPAGDNLQDAIVQLDKSQQELLVALSGFDSNKLDETVPNQKYSFYKLLHGIVHHDLYHVGQIVMITKQF